jgi:GNAT superfamily N-acetyltransferase
MCHIMPRGEAFADPPRLLPVGLDAAALRRAYDETLRTFVPARLPAGVTVDTDGPLIRLTEDGGFVTYRSVGGLAPADLDALIARTRDHYAARGLAVEWKLHGHDEPTDLPERLVAAGFVPEEAETVVIGRAAPLADAAPPLPAGVRLREVTERADLDRIEDLKVAVWGGARSGQADSLAREIAGDPTGITVVLAERGAEPVGPGPERAEPVGPGPERVEPGPVASAAWVRYVPGTEFATLWGGATLPEWRGRGIYRALVAYRAALAVARGHTYLQVDASPMSRPILERLGFVAVTTTTPYVFTP